MAKKKRTALPRVTVLAMNRKDLAAFVGAVETLRLLVDDLRLMLDRKKQSAAKTAAKTAAPSTGAQDVARPVGVK